MKYYFFSCLGHFEERRWKKPKDGKSHCRATNFLEVLFNDEEATIQQLNKFYENETLFSYTQMPKRRMLANIAPGGVVLTFEATRDGSGINQDTVIKSKILSHFMKGKISLSPMEIILMIPKNLNTLKVW
jgi:hypothetical protein